MSIPLDKFIQELDSASPGFKLKVEQLYPVAFNIQISGMPKFSINLNQNNQSFNFSEHIDAQFSLSLNIFSALNAIKNKIVPSESISGNIEDAVIFLGVIAHLDIDLELLIYKHFGDIPALILRKVLLGAEKGFSSESRSVSNNQLLKSLRDISIRLDRLEHSLIK